MKAGVDSEDKAMKAKLWLLPLLLLPLLLQPLLLRQRNRSPGRDVPRTNKLCVVLSVC
jgi:hypothetical protein